MVKTAIHDGIEVLRERVKALSGRPGVYRMLSEDGSVLYVGKAKNLKNRVVQYTQTERMVARIRKMVFETRDLVVVETPTEAEALLLEANLIKSLKPRYNIIFRDDASYVSVVITDEETPMIRSHRGAKRMKGEYFGPYPSAMAVYSTLELMEKAFRLRTCSDGVFRNRTRPCLKYDIKRCSAPCVGKIGAEEYKGVVRQAKRFLKGERQAVLKDLQEQMQSASEQMEYERAGALRDRIRAIDAVVGVSTALSHALPEADVFALVAMGGRVAVQAFYYRSGQHSGNHTFYPAHLVDVAEESLAEAMRLFLLLHYAGGRGVPPRIYVNLEPNEMDVVAEALSLSAGRKITIEKPQRGERVGVVKQAEENASQAVQRKALETNGWAMQMGAFGEMLGREVKTVECYDISNISGKYPVASLVVAGEEGMMKQRYRRYQIRSKDTPDDFAMMREVLGRRIARGMKEGGLPDVILVDGGKGQLSSLVAVAKEAGLLEMENPPELCGIAKGEERDKGLEVIFRWQVLEDGEEVLDTLPIAFNSPLKFLLQRIRDEAHRFAITYHRQQRSKALVVSRLDEIPGVGPKKKKALLLHFGSVAGVEAADVKALAAVPGMSMALAQIVYDFFHG